MKIVCLLNKIIGKQKIIKMNFLVFSVSVSISVYIFNLQNGILLYIYYLQPVP